MASSTALQLGKSSWPSQILLVHCLGKASTTPERQVDLCMLLEWTLSKRLGLAYSFSAAASVCISREAWKHGRLHIFKISLLGILGPGDRRLCMRLAHYRPFSVTSQESLRESQNHHLMDTRAPRQGSIQWGGGGGGGGEASTPPPPPPPPLWNDFFPVNSLNAPTPFL